MATDRVATRDSPQRPRAAANDSIFRDRIARIHRATWLEPASRSVHRMNQRRDCRPINRYCANRENSRRSFQSIRCICNRHQLCPAIRPLKLRAAIVSSSPIAGDASAAVPPRAITTIDVPNGSCARSSLPKNLPHAPLYPVAHHRIADSARHGHAQARTRRLVVETTGIHDKMGTLETHAVSLEA